jgi:hypothetical protein
LIFFVYLYQRWIYPIDKKRVNEFGQEFEDEIASDRDGNPSHLTNTPTPTQLKEGGEGGEGEGCPTDVSESREDVLTDGGADTLSPYKEAEELEELVKPKSGKSGSGLQKRTKRSKA